MTLPILVWIFAFGACIGSFLNVCIYRLPRDRSIHQPARSHCPACDAPIRFYDNIPILSYLLLRGRCRHCHASISIRYPLVELLGGLLAASVAARYGWTLSAIAVFLFACCLLVVTFIDIDFQIIPNEITLPGIPLFFIASWALQQVSWSASLIGIALGGGTLYLIDKLYFMLRKRQGIGGGDVKLLAMIGAMVGWQGVIFTIFVGSLSGLLVGLALMVVARTVNPQFRIPFGPFLSIGALCYLFWGPMVINWYLHLGS